jgi:very-short-patch-repair endonuclease
MLISKRIKEQSLFLGASPNIFQKARSLRKRMTKAEKTLWVHLRRKTVNGKRFRRQHPIDQFIADFYCHEAKLVIEVDGGIHMSKNQKERDEMRTFELQSKGINVIRFTNDEVLFDIDNVIKRIEENLI